MEPDASEPLEGVDTDDVSIGTVEPSEVRAALDATDMLVRQRGVDVCSTLAEDDPDAVREYVEDLAGVLEATNGPVTLGAIEALKPLAKTDPAALDGALADLAALAGSDLVDVQLTAGDVVSRVVVERPALCAPHVDLMVEGLVATEPDESDPDYSEYVEDEQTLQTLQEHDESERRRLVSARRLWSNVVVAIAEEQPESLLDSVEELITLTDDPDAGVAGGAIDAIGELALADRDAVAPAGEALIDSLEHGDISVRARAIRAIGHLGVDAAVPQLQDMAENDPNEDVQEIAADTAEFLASLDPE